MTQEKKNDRNLVEYVVPLASSIICAFISAFISIMVADTNAQAELKKLEEEFALKTTEMQHENTYSIKKDAILKALTMIDTYISWQTLSEVVPARKETTATALTEEARDCYNRLCVTCDNAKLLDVFLNCILGAPEDGTIPMGFLNQFRNEARKELGLPPLPLNMDRIYISVVSTRDLSAASPHPEQAHILTDSESFRMH